MTNRSINYKINIILFMGLFIFSFQFRGMLFQGNLKSMNFLALIAIIMLLIFNNKKNKIGILILTYTSIIMIISQYANHKGIVETIVVFSCIILPNFLIFVNIPKNEFEDIFKLYIKFLNILVICLITFAIMDKFTDASIARFFANIFNDKFFYNSVISDATNRYYSFMGHPLYNTQIFLMFYVINFCGKKYFNYGLSMFIVTIITILGISFTASKTGFILLLICLIFLKPIDNKKWLYPIILVVITFVVIKMGLFETLIYRFKTQTLTSGRDEVWKILNNANIFPIRFWIGYGSGFNNIYNQYITLASAAFEYPIRLFALEYGIVYTVGIYISIFIQPILKFLKNKQFILLICFGIVFVDVNTYNGIGLGMDIMLMFATFVYIIVNLSDYLVENNKYKGE